MKNFFKDPAQQAFYEQNGYVKVQLLDEADLAALWDTYKLMPPPTVPARGFHTSLFFQQMEFRKKAHDVISSILWKRVEPIMHECRKIFGSFVVKEPGESSIVNVHQDWTFVDEDKGYRSFNVWCPMMETNETNGNLYVLPGSHRLPAMPRVSPSSYYPYGTEQCWDYIKNNSIVLPTKAGEAIIYDQVLIHYSPPNLSDKTRVVAGMLVIPEEAPLVLLTAKRDSFEYKKYYVKDDFYFGYDYVNLPTDSEPETLWFKDTFNPYRALVRVSGK